IYQDIINWFLPVYEIGRDINCGREAQTPQYRSGGRSSGAEPVIDRNNNRPIRQIFVLQFIYCAIEFNNSEALLFQPCHPLGKIWWIHEKFWAKFVLRAHGEPVITQYSKRFAVEEPENYENPQELQGIQCNQ